jgi:hypothetical protein
MAKWFKALIQSGIQGETMVEVREMSLPAAGNHSGRAVG